MLQITIPSIEEWDEVNQEFVHTKEHVLQLEHSLVSISKWESKWCKVFLSKQQKTKEEALDYVRCMTLTQNIDPKIYDLLTKANMDQITDYIDAKMTATPTLSNDKSGKPNRDLITSEYIYYMMVALNIPFECQKWHLKRLFALIHICNIKNQKPKKQSRRESAEGISQRAALNAARKKQFNTKG